MNENVFVAALQEINNHPVRFGECTITFTFHDGRLQFYTVQTSERKTVADIKSNFGEQIIRMENQHENKNDNSHYFILIPSEVLRMSELSEGAKLLFGEILFLSKKENYCYANNDYFVRLNGVSKRTIVSRLKELKDHKLIRTEVFRNKNQQVEKRNIYVLQNYPNRNVTVENNRQMADGKASKKITMGENQNVFSQNPN